MNTWRKAVSRRKLLQLVGYSVAAFPVAALVPKLAWAQGKTSKQAANYQNQPNGNQQCAGCANFIAPNACKLVEGKVSPQGWCKLYAPKQG